MPIAYTEKGKWMHQEIARQGYRLTDRDGVWQSDDDFDGRRFWERSSRTSEDGQQQEQPRQAKDPEGNCGGSLDLTG